MIPVAQTITRPEDGPNCFAAGLASILELDIGDVPNAAAEWFTGGGGFEAGWALIRVWLADLGLYLLSFGDEQDLAGWRPDGYWLAVIDSPRQLGETHIVVMEDGHPVWDPHPDVAEPDSAAPIVAAYVLAVRDAARLTATLPLHSPPALDRLRPYLRPAAPAA